MQHSLHLRDFLENLQNQRFLHPHVAGAFKSRVFRSRGGSIWSQWGGAGASVHEIHSSTTRDTTLDIRSGEGSTLRSPARCPPRSSSAEIPVKNPPVDLRILWPKIPRKLRKLAMLASLRNHKGIKSTRQRFNTSVQF